MMDCDTTGIEPDIALIKYKRLVGGGMIKIVNNTITEALAKLGLRRGPGEGDRRLHRHRGDDRGARRG
jgi:ribonucleoside-diphosphate reductase alpha chain